MLLNCGVGEDSWESLGQQGDQTRISILKEINSWILIGRTDVDAKTLILWPPDAKSQLIGKDSDAGKDWGQEEREEGDRGWGSWMASLTQWTWVWANSGREKPGMLQSMGFQRGGHIYQFSTVQLLSHVWLFVTPWTAACQASLSITSSQSLLKFVSVE